LGLPLDFIDEFADCGNGVSLVLQTRQKSHYEQREFREVKMLLIGQRRHGGKCSCSEDPAVYFRDA